MPANRNTHTHTFSMISLPILLLVMNTLIYMNVFEMLEHVCLVCNENCRELGGFERCPGEEVQSDLATTSSVRRSGASLPAMSPLQPRALDEDNMRIFES